MIMPKRKPVIKSKKALRKIRVDAEMETDEFWDRTFDAISQAAVPFIWVFHLIMEKTLQSYSKLYQPKRRKEYI
tara:strand:- start:330 stop:551 length:222 start_codon:yes stop_codon:yes gene_type:complete